MSVSETSDPCSVIKNAADIEVQALSKVTEAIGTENENAALQEYETAKSNFENLYTKCEESKSTPVEPVESVGGKRKRTAKKRRSQKKQKKQTKKQQRKTRRQMKKTHWK